MSQNDIKDLKTLFDKGLVLEYQDGFTAGNVVEFTSDDEVLVMDYSSDEEFTIDLSKISPYSFSYY